MSGAAVGRYLADRGVAFALIGAQAMVLRGIVRFSLDIDFLTVDRAVLLPEFWGELQDATIDVRRGDLTAPLAGVVRIGGDRDFDVVECDRVGTLHDGPLPFVFADDHVDRIVRKR